MNTAGLTAPQAKALLFIAAVNESLGLSPTLAEIGAHLGLKGKSGVHALLVGLRARGRVTWQRGQKRSLRILPDNSYTLPRATQIALDRFCLAQQEAAADVVADAVLLHIDMLENEGPAGGRRREG